MHVFLTVEFNLLRFRLSTCQRVELIAMQRLLRQRQLNCRLAFPPRKLRKGYFCWCKHGDSSV
jgi:hypothetical protein